MIFLNSYKLFESKNIINKTKVTYSHYSEMNKKKKENFNKKQVEDIRKLSNRHVVLRGNEVRIVGYINTIFIYKMEDEYYCVNIMNRDTRNGLYYICDQFDELVELINSI